MVILLIFSLSGCFAPLPQHSKGQLKSYAKENYGNIAKVVSFENERDKNILVIEDNLGFTYEVVSESDTFNLDGADFFYMLPSITDNYKEKYYEYLFNIDEVKELLSNYNVEFFGMWFSYHAKLVDNNKRFDIDKSEEYTKGVYNLIKENDIYNLFDSEIYVYKAEMIDYSDGSPYLGNSHQSYKYNPKDLSTNNNINIDGYLTSDNIENYGKKYYGTCDYLGEKDIDPKESPALYAMLEEAINNYVGNEEYSSMLESCPVYYFRNYYRADYIYFHIVKSDLTVPSYTMCDFVPKFCEYYQEELNKFAEELGGTTCRYEWNQGNLKLDLYINNGKDRFNLSSSELNKLNKVEDDIYNFLSRNGTINIISKSSIMIYYE